MKKSTMLRLGIGLAVLVIIALFPVLLSAQSTPPSIPHPVEGREACLICHEAGLGGAPQIPADHAGRPNEVCQGCHQVAAASEASPTAATAETNTPEPTATPTTAATATRTPANPTAVSGPAGSPTAEFTATLDEPAATPTTEPAATPTTEPAATPTVEPAATPTAEPVAEPAGPAPVPHTLEGRENCLECHVSGEAPAVPAGGPPVIPHSLVGRDNCLACHEQGIGGAPQIPADHQGRTDEVCQGCHQPGQPAATTTPAAPAEPIPTPLVYPQATGVNTCVDCHATLAGEQIKVTEQWQRSIHAERGVSCADCHGGNPAGRTVDQAMSPDAGYIGAPAKADIPALCASCHADVSKMRQYDLPTDQYAKYKESIHGIRLAEGDTNVTTCFDCHGGHQILKANDPASTVYPSNVPKLCATCHSDKELMAPYNIPTNQYDLYRQSVHGHALLDQQDFRAPNCATCHGTHGAAPPGFAEVANVCGSCHSATQEYYLKSSHASAGDSGPKCITCHGRYDVSKPGEALYLGSEPRHCGSCHAPDSAGGRAAQALYDSVTGAVIAYEEAEMAVQAARRVGMLVSPMEAQLQQANTDLVTARAAQHTLNQELVSGKTDEAVQVAEEVKASAQADLDESVFRRRAMIVAVIAIALVVVALYLLKTELDRRLEAGK